MITPTELKDVLEYRDGQLFRLHGRFAGLVKGTKQATGYLTLKVKDEQFYYHRVVWALFYDEWPDSLDHINQDKHDNRIENLRLASQRVNNFNRGVAKNNKLGFTGIAWQKAKGKFRAYLGRKHLGFFKTKDEAIAARVKAEADSPDHLRAAS